MILTHPSPATPLPLTLAWRALDAHASEISKRHLRDLIAEGGKARWQNLCKQAAGLTLDLSRQPLTTHTLDLLQTLAAQEDLKGWRARLFGGEPVNASENRPALHMALRAGPQDRFAVAGADVLAETADVRERMLAFAESVRTGEALGGTGKPIRRVVHIGIGGSDLGPRMALTALAPYAIPTIKIDFVSNVDGAQLADVLAGCEAAETLFIIVSKTFTTAETMANAASAKAWLLEKLGANARIDRHFAAVSTNLAATAAFGLPPERVFGFRDWVGGRYSLWSSVGLSLAIAIGADNFRALLAGAANMDRHFQTAEPEDNLPVLLALAGVWQINFWNRAHLAVLPYSQRLALLPAFLQQLEMESNGKSVDRSGAPIDHATAPILFGSAGTDGQHSFFQLLHQGTSIVPCDFIGVLEANNTLPEARREAHQRALLANLLAQAEAMAVGLDDPSLPPWLRFAGNRPSTLLTMQALTPETLGSLIALYEHKVFVQAVIWRINPFDQWGVELGKKCATTIEAELAGGVSAKHDAATAATIGEWLGTKHA